MVDEETRQLGLFLWLVYACAFYLRVAWLYKKGAAITYLKFVLRYLAAVFMRGEYKLSRTK